ncbi:hypothetical protein [Nocardia aurantiaca]|uniref:Uncharacterized protein n=1 Tax=Nocardia aurantiaca TaxID=2675850 RepID=A0A6I3L5R0_9NOCA|nr:hypothetical protein [Nocardia aurantiaca]MTE17227.1 hypothetical protein [Nocardia aurantiaca]
MQRYRAALDTAGGYAAAAIAGLALIVPVGTGCDTDSSALQMMLLTITLPRATAAGAVVAVLTAVCARMFGTRAAWGTATVATLVLATNHLLVTTTSASLATANFADALAAGVLLGAAGAAALEHRPPTIGYLLGALTGVIVGDNIETVAAETGGQSLLERAFVDLPPDWLTIPTVALLAVCFLLCHRTEASSYPTTLNLPFGPILSAAVVITTTAVVSERLTSETTDTTAIALGALAVLVAAVVAALLLPGRDGTLALLAVSLAATGSAIAIAAQAHWKLAPMLVVMALGLAAGLLRPAPVVAAGAIVLIGIFALLAPGVRHDDSWTALIGSCAIAALAGYSFGAVITGNAAGTVLALGILFVPTAVLTLEYRGCEALPDRAAASGNRAAWTAIALGVGCVAAIIALRRWRPERVEQD